MAIFILGILITLSIPAAAQWQTSRVVSQGNLLILTGDPQKAEQGVTILKGAVWCNNSCYDGIIDAYLSPQTSKPDRIVLANAYFEITGENIKNIIESIFQD